MWMDNKYLNKWILCEKMLIFTKIIRAPENIWPDVEIQVKYFPNHQFSSSQAQYMSEIVKRIKEITNYQQLIIKQVENMWRNDNFELKTSKFAPKFYQAVIFQVLAYSTDIS